MLRRILLLAPFAALPALSGCSEYFTDPYDWGTVEAWVLDQTGAPVADASLTLYSGTRHLGIARTDADGYHRFRFVPPGSLGVSVSPPSPAANPQYQFTTFRMEEGQHRELTFHVSLCEGGIRVSVADPHGAAAQGVEVQLYRWDGGVARQATDAAGQVRFAELPCDNYGVRLLPSEGFDFEEGAGSSWVDGLSFEHQEELEVSFVVTRD